MDASLVHCGVCGFIHTGACPIPIPVFCPKCQTQGRRHVMAGLAPESTESVAVSHCHIGWWARIENGKPVLKYRKKLTKSAENVKMRQ